MGAVPPPSHGYVPVDSADVTLIKPDFGWVQCRSKTKLSKKSTLIDVKQHSNEISALRNNNRIEFSESRLRVICLTCNTVNSHASRGLYDACLTTTGYVYKLELSGISFFNIFTIFLLSFSIFLLRSISSCPQLNFICASILIR